jgi:hypothetical protein
MQTAESSDEASFRDVVQGLLDGDFSRLEPVFSADPGRDGPPQIVRWHKDGRFRDQPKGAA